MADVVVLGGGVIGLSTGLMLAGQGHAVTVLERDAERVPGSPDDAWDRWERPGVAQFRQPHYLHPAGTAILASRLPAVRDALETARAAQFDVLSLMPPFITDRAPRDGDERLRTLTARRPVVEYATASVAREILDVRTGAAVAGLLTGPPVTAGVPHVTGVRLADGTPIPASLVVDAMGRRSALPRWLAAIGGRAPAEEAAESGFVYYTRFFRPAIGGAPPVFRTGLVADFDCFSLLTLPGDADTWSVTVCLPAGDQALKELRQADRWTALVSACPLHAHLLDGVPLTGVLAMGGIVDRIRHFAPGGAPVATGVLAVGDAWACTNPSLGRGITIGLMHAEGTAAVAGEHLGDPLALAHAHDAMTQSRVTPWFRSTVQTDRARRAAMVAAGGGRRTARPRPGAQAAAGTGRAGEAGETARADEATGAGRADEAAEAADPGGPAWRAFPRAMLYDAELFRAFVEMTGMLATPAEVMSRPGLAEKILAVAAGQEEFVMPGPSRADVLSLL